MALVSFWRRTRPPRPKPRFYGELEKWQHVLPELELLVHATADFIVFVNIGLDVDWETTPEYDARGHKDEAEFNRIRNQVALLEATPCAELPRETKAEFKYLIGEGLDRGLQQDYSAAKAVLGAAAEYVLKRSQETSRCWYLTSSAVMTLPFVIVAAVFWSTRYILFQVIGETAFWLAIAAVAGALGALLSVIGRTGKLQFDCASGRRLHYLEGASRIWAGALSGLFVGLAVHSDLILTALTRGGKVPAIMILAAMASGTGERFANSIIADLSGAKTETLKHGADHELSGTSDRQSG